MRDRYRDRVRFIEARGVSYAQTFPYWPIRDLLREWLGVGASTPEARVRLELKAELAHLLGREEAEDAYPFLASLRRPDARARGARRIRELNRESIQSRTFEVFYELVCKLAEEEPLCLVFEDLHWADEATLELLESMLGMTDEEPRSRSSSSTAPSASTAPGGSASSRGSATRTATGRSRCARSRRTRRACSSRTRPTASCPSRSPSCSRSAPAATRSSSRRPSATSSSGACSSAGTAAGSSRSSEDELSIPAVVQGTLQARLDRLDRQTREVLSIAAVIGRTFGLPLLERLVRPRPAHAGADRRCSGSI